MNAVIRHVCRNVERWREAQMALRSTAADMLEAAKGIRRLNAYRRLPDLKAALEMHRAPATDAPVDPFAQTVPHNQDNRSTAKTAF